jgi:hypothetical protein
VAGEETTGPESWLFFISLHICPGDGAGEVLSFYAALRLLLLLYL